MPKKEFFAIGHITNDTVPTPHVGGGVSYTAYVARQLGYESHIVTKAPEDSQFVRELQALGIVVHCLPALDARNADKITSFTNIDDAKGSRKQLVSDVQETIGLDDVRNFPNMSKDALVLVAPVIGEVAPELVEKMGKRRSLAVTPQGYFRQVQPDGSVVRKPWDQADVLRHSSASILSNEDLTFENRSKMDPFARFELQRSVPLLVITEGADGSEISLQQRANRIQIQAMDLRPTELRDFTGAGDVYALAFLAQLTETQDVVQAGVFASLYSALKIADIAGGQHGLATVPSLEQVKEFKNRYPRRVRYLLLDNGLEEKSGLLID